MIKLFLTSVTFHLSYNLLVSVNGDTAKDIYKNQPTNQNPNEKAFVFKMSQIDLIPYVLLGEKKWKERTTGEIKPERRGLQCLIQEIIWAVNMKVANRGEICDPFQMVITHGE